MKQILRFSYFTANIVKFTHFVIHPKNEKRVKIEPGRLGVETFKLM